MQNLFFLNIHRPCLNYKLLFCSILTIQIFIVTAIPRSAGATETDSLDGSELYHDYCSVCHGDRGDGESWAKNGLSTPPRDFAIQGLDKLITRDQMIDIVLNGRPGTAMAGWGTRLSRTQAEIIVDYIRDKFMLLPVAMVKDGIAPVQANTGMSAEQIAEPIPSGLTGNYANGEKFYNDNCSTCHGMDGGGNGPRAYFINPKPRNFLEADTRMRLNRPLLFYAIKHGIKGKEMPAWGKVIDDQQIADVTEYVFTKMIR